MPEFTSVFWKSYSSPRMDGLLHALSLQSETEISAGLENVLASFKEAIEDHRPLVERRGLIIPFDELVADEYCQITLFSFLHGNLLAQRAAMKFIEPHFDALNVIDKMVVCGAFAEYAIDIAEVARWSKIHYEINRDGAVADVLIWLAAKNNFATIKKLMDNGYIPSCRYSDGVAENLSLQTMLYVVANNGRIRQKFVFDLASWWLSSFCGDGRAVVSIHSGVKFSYVPWYFNYQFDTSSESSNEAKKDLISRVDFERNNSTWDFDVFYVLLDRSIKMLSNNDVNSPLEFVCGVGVALRDRKVVDNPDLDIPITLAFADIFERFASESLMSMVKQPPLISCESFDAVMASLQSMNSYQAATVLINILLAVKERVDAEGVMPAVPVANSVEESAVTMVNSFFRRMLGSTAIFREDYLFLEHQPENVRQEQLSKLAQLIGALHGQSWELPKDSSMQASEDDIEALTLMFVEYQPKNVEMPTPTDADMTAKV